MTQQLASAIETIPDPQKIREQLAANLRERKILRRLLKVAEYTADELTAGCDSESKEVVTQ